MEHVAIDLGGRKSQICIRASSGEVVLERTHATVDLGEFLARRSPSVVVMETCAEAFGVADAARAAGHTVRVVSATLVRALGVGARGIKTDRRDARLLSEASCRMDLPSVHVPSHDSREHKSVCGMRDELVESRTKLINSVRGWLRATARRPATGTVKTFVARVKLLLGETLPLHVGALLAALDAINVQIDVLETSIKERAKKSSVCRQLQSVPGVGPITSLRFVATLDQLDRFESAHAVESYLGITPGERSSSEKTHRTGITKAGAPKTRWCLVQAAWSAWRSRPNDPMVLWAKEVEKRRGRRVAIVALARKIAGILYALWRDGTLYQPHEGASITQAA